MRTPRLPLSLLVLTLAACTGDKPAGGDDSESFAELPLQDYLSCPGEADPMPIEDVVGLEQLLTAVVPMSTATLLDARVLELARQIEAAVEAEGEEEDCVDLVEDAEAGTFELSATCDDILDGLTLTGTLSASGLDGSYSSSWAELVAVGTDLVIQGDGALSYTEVGEGAFEASADRTWFARTGTTSIDGTFTLRASGTTSTSGLLYSGVVQVVNAPSAPDGEACFATTGFDEGEHPTGATSHAMVQGSQLWDLYTGAEGCHVASADGVEIEDTCG